MTDAEFRDAAVASLKRTSISYPEWQKRVAAGRYADVTKTEWWKAFDALGNIGAVVPPPPPTGVFFNGDFQTGDLSQWPDLSNLGAGIVANTPKGPLPKSFKSVIPAGSNRGSAYVQHLAHPNSPSWTKIPVDAWHRVMCLFPSGNNSDYPGQYRIYPSGGWSAGPLEWHNRTDGQSGYNYPGTTPASYLSSMLGVHNNADGTASFAFRVAGGQLHADGTANISLVDKFSIHLGGPLLVWDKWVEQLVRFVYSDDPAVGSYEWWVGIDGGAPKLMVQGKAPTAYVCGDGLSGTMFQCGNYRGSGSSSPFAYDDTMYVAGVKVGPSRASVGG